MGREGQQRENIEDNSKSSLEQQRGLKYYLPNGRGLGEIKICIIRSPEVEMKRRNRKWTESGL